VNRWRERLYEALVDQPQPVFTSGDTTIPAASIWTGSRHWIRALRDGGIAPSDVVGIHLTPGPAFVQLLVAALCNNNIIAIGDLAGAYAHVIIADDMATPVAGPTGPLVRREPTQQLSFATMLRFVFCGLAEPVAWHDRDVDGWIEFLGAASPMRNAVLVADSEWRSAGTIVRNTLTPICLGAAHVIIPASPADRRTLTRQYTAEMIEV
jgi:hypothetical protein